MLPHVNGYVKLVTGFTVTPSVMSPGVELLLLLSVPNNWLENGEATFLEHSVTVFKSVPTRHKLIKVVVNMQGPLHSMMLLTCLYLSRSPRETTLFKIIFCYDILPLLFSTKHNYFILHMGLFLFPESIRSFLMTSSAQRNECSLTSQFNSAVFYGHLLLCQCSFLFLAPTYLYFCGSFMWLNILHGVWFTGA